jgi:hypothetical protein
MASDVSPLQNSAYTHPLWTVLFQQSFWARHRRFTPKEVHVNLALMDIISLIFLITSAIYLFFGLVVLSYNTQSAIHRLLCISFLCLTWWSFTFSVANNAPNYEAALFWRRLASAGWGVYYSPLLHFILLLTERNALLNKYWSYLFLYLPALLNIFLYGIFDQTALQVYELVQTPAGWVNVAGILPLDLSHFLHYLVFLLTGIILLLHWGMTARERAKRDIARIIGHAAAAALIIGTFTEHLIYEVFQINFPQLAPIVILIPALAMFYCIRRYGMMRQLPKDMTLLENQMFSKYAQSKLHFYLAMMLLLGGFLGFAALHFTNRASLTFAMMFGSVFTAAGIIVYSIRSLDLKPALKDTITGMTMAAMVLVLTVLVYHFTATHAWALPLAFVLLMVIFSDRRIVALMGMSIFFSLIWSWVKVPVFQMTFTAADHLIRMAIMVLMVGFICYINHVFRQAIAENRERADREEFLSKVASVLMTADGSNIDDKVEEVLAWWGKHLRVECIYALFLDDDQLHIPALFVHLIR